MNNDWKHIPRDDRYLDTNPRTHLISELRKNPQMLQRVGREEIVIAVIALAALCFILWSRKLFPVPENVPATVANPAQGSVIASDSEAAPGRPGDSANS